MVERQEVSKDGIARRAMRFMFSAAGKMERM